MSTTQAPFYVDDKRLYRGKWCIIGPVGIQLDQYEDYEEATTHASDLSAAYAAGQLSKQAELDKAVALLRELATIPPRMTDGFYTDEILAARAYLSTLNPQPHD